MSGLSVGRPLQSAVDHLAATVTVSFLRKTIVPQNKRKCVSYHEDGWTTMRRTAARNYTRREQ
jgi:hypothetical protein